MTLITLTPNHEQLARYAKALGHPVRVYIMELLSSQSCCFSGDLAEDLPIARSTLSQHLKELKAAGLIQGTIEYPKIRYCVNKENWEKAKFLFSDLFKTSIKLNTDCENNPENQSGKKI
jgi:ArsR family transcriptional regulator, arsenate/arsenite/antimonite-responsive transcriptional repressor